MIIDSADWHQGRDFPAGLPPEAGATHIGIFLAWAVNNELVSAAIEEEHVEALRKVRSRIWTGRQFLDNACDGYLTDGDLADEARRFSSKYYGTLDSGDGTACNPYLEDYEHTLAAGLPSFYHVYDSWDNYDLLAPVLDATFADWRAGL